MKTYKITLRDGYGEFDVQANDRSAARYKGYLEFRDVYKVTFKEFMKLIESSRQVEQDGDYDALLDCKVELAVKGGFDIALEDISPALKPHQALAVQWAVRGGCRALFESFGLGKTVQELEWCRIITERIGGKALIVLPLGVRQEFTRDAVQLLGWPAAPNHPNEPAGSPGAPVYVRTQAEAKAAAGRILMTNYERMRDGDIDPASFTACCLDEASVLRSFGSKTYQTFLQKFKSVLYKLVATATPSPNRYKELIHYAGYLGVMDTGQALTRFFKSDKTKAGNLTLLENREREFWLWVSSWALFITKPSDLDPSFDDTGYDLPPLEVRRHVIRADFKELPEEKDGQVKFMRNPAQSLSDAAREKNRSITARVAKAAEIVAVAEPDERFILWHDLEAERAEVKKVFPEAVDIYGSMDYDERERRTIDFSEGRIRLFATKKSLSGCGCNFQRHCWRAIFIGIDYEFNDFIQAIHRIHRFLQGQRVIIDIIYTEAEQKIYGDLMAKWKRHDYLADKMREIIKEYGLNSDIAVAELRRQRGVERVEVKGRHYTAVLNDCVEEAALMEENSVDLIHTSIPFGNHYEYSANYNDFGHNIDTAAFFKQMDFLTPNLLRVLRPGRVAAIHVKDRVLPGKQTGLGMYTIEPFHADCIGHYMRHGLRFMGQIVVLTDVVRENNQTYRLGWSQQCLDGTKMGVGCPEYILLFRKLPSDTGNAFADVPVEKSKEDYTRAEWQLDAHAFHRSSGDRLLFKDEYAAVPAASLGKVYRKYSRENVYSFEEHRALCQHYDEKDQLPATFMALPPASWSDQVWDDINRMRTLNADQKSRRLQMHVCPLQLDVVERVIRRYSNEGDLVLDPFAGIMTVPYVAVKMGRRGYGIELSADYFRDGLGYLREAEAERDAPTLFDLMEVGAA